MLTCACVVLPDQLFWVCPVPPKPSRGLRWHFLEPGSLRCPRKALEHGYCWQNRVFSRTLGNTKPKPRMQNGFQKSTGQRHLWQFLCMLPQHWHYFSGIYACREGCWRLEPSAGGVRSTWALSSAELRYLAEVLQYLHFTPLLADSNLLTWHTAEHEAAASPLPSLEGIVSTFYDTHVVTFMCSAGLLLSRADVRDSFRASSHPCSSHFKHCSCSLATLFLSCAASLGHKLQQSLCQAQQTSWQTCQ